MYNYKSNWEESPVKEISKNSFYRLVVLLNNLIAEHSKENIWSLILSSRLYEDKGKVLNGKSVVFIIFRRGNYTLYNLSDWHDNKGKKHYSLSKSIRGIS